MRRTAWTSGLLLLAFAFAGCVKDEIPVPKQPRGNAEEATVHLGSDYALQVWYDLGTNSVVSTNSKMDWDLAFESGVDGWQVRLNSARLMRIHGTGQDDITQATDTNGYGNTWRIDLPDGRVDSLAFGDWRTDHPVFVLDMGYGVNGLPIGLRKVQLLDVATVTYHFRTAAMDGSDVQEFTVQKDPDRAYAHFSFSSGGAVAIGPPLGNYDLVFTQYTEQFYYPDPYLAYLVTGVLDGHSGTRVAQLQGDFSSVTLEDTLAHPFSTDEDAIGYDWKDYSFDSGTYEIYADKIYIIQDRDGYFYKLHFIDYYDEQGQSGSPKFEVEPL